VKTRFKTVSEARARGHVKEGRILQYRAALALLVLNVTAMSPVCLPGAEVFDCVIFGGRVMDPETGLDAVRTVGIHRGVIAAVSETMLEGRETIDATGLVVAPGFIDLHQHAMDEESLRLRARDGVTSVLELEVGTADVERWYAERGGKSLLHHGVAVGHIPVRMKVMGDFPAFLPKSDSRAATFEASAVQLERIQQGLTRGLEAGAVAVGFGLGYTPAATDHEIRTMFGVAASFRASCHVHLQGRRQDAVESARELAAISAATGAPLHIVHLQATAVTSTPEMLRLVEESQAAGLDVSAEVYPWTAGMTEIQSALFGEGWEKRYGVGYGDLQWGATGERLTTESFQRYRKTGGLVIVHVNTESTVAQAVAHPLTMIASDGLPGHPRNAGTCARVLGHYAREQGSPDLMTALKKLSLMPAQRLEGRVPAMKQKGRVRQGCDADLVLFDAATVGARATYDDPVLPSAGIPWVLVSGQAVVRDGRLVEDALPGQAIRAPSDPGGQ
jgi:N-acyl-D-aspartate/D-glutamate deacylase